jgi:flagellar biogenesis protein FliO
VATNRSKLFVFIAVLFLPMVALLLPSSWASNAPVKPKSHTAIQVSKEPEKTAIAEPILVDPEQQPLSVYETHHEQARQASGRSIGRLLLGLLGVLALLGVFARWGLPHLVARYPQFFEYWQRHSTENRSAKESKQKAESVKAGNTKLPDQGYSSDLVNESLATLGGLRLVSSTLLNTSQELHLVEVGDRQLIIVSTADGVKILCDLAQPPKDSVANRTHHVQDLFPSKSSIQSSPTVSPISQPSQDTPSDSSSFSAARQGLLKNTLKTFVPSVKKSPSSWILQGEELKDASKTKPYASSPSRKSYSKLISKQSQKVDSVKSEMSIELLGDYDDIF